MHVSGKTLIPHTWCLFESVQIFVKVIDMRRLFRINEPRLLLAVDGFIQTATEECILDIELVDGQRTGNNKIKNESNCGGFDNRTESLVEVNARLLGIPTNDPPSPMVLEGAVRVEFMLKYPLVSDDVGVMRTGYQGPNMVIKESFELFRHGVMPIGVIKSRAISLGNGRDRIACGKQIQPIHRFDYTVSGVGDHMTLTRDRASNRYRDVVFGICRGRGSSGATRKSVGATEELVDTAKTM